MTTDQTASRDVRVTERPSGPTIIVLEAAFPGFTPAELFRYWTVPDLITLWWPPEAQIDAEPGGAYRLSWPRQDWHLYGTFTTFDPGKALGFTWQWSHLPDEAPTEVAMAFEPTEEGAMLTLTHGPYRDDDAGREERRGTVEGWMFFLPRLQDLRPDVADGEGEPS